MLSDKMGLNIAKLEEYHFEKDGCNYPFFVQRDDLLHPMVSGNKWRKLKGWIEEYELGGFEGIVTFGGAFSNHLLATSAACNHLNIPCIGIVRGEEGFDNYYLKECRKQGMETQFVSRESYRNKEAISSGFSKESRKWLIIPEGGKGKEGSRGFKDLVDSWRGNYPDIVVHASATATTAIGLGRYLPKETMVKSVMVLKNVEEQTEALNWCETNANLEFIKGFEFGGYAKSNEELTSFISEVNNWYPFQIERIYTGKAFFAMLHHILPQYPDKKVVFLHTGGLWNES